MYKNNFTALQAFREDVTLPPHALVGNEGDRVLLGLRLNLPWTALGGAREQIKLNWKEKAVTAKHQI